VSRPLAGLSGRSSGDHDGRRRITRRKLPRPRPPRASKATNDLSAAHATPASLKVRRFRRNRSLTCLATPAQADAQAPWSTTTRRSLGRSASAVGSKPGRDRIRLIAIAPPSPIAGARDEVRASADARSEPSRSASVRRQQRRADCSYPCIWALLRRVDPPAGALLLLLLDAAAGLAITAGPRQVSA
jgi:hypothetical protein